MGGSFHSPPSASVNSYYPERISSSLCSSLLLSVYSSYPKPFKECHFLSHCVRFKMAFFGFFNAPQRSKASFLRCVALKKPLHFREEALYRGPERIRTAVEAFAELCLATRPQDLFGTRK